MAPRTRKRPKSVSQRNRRRPSGTPSPRLDAKMLADFDEMMEAIERAVHACIRLRRWEDLEAAVAEYSRDLRVNPCLLLFSAITRPLVRHALNLTDAGKLAEFAVHIRSGIELANSGWSLRRSIEFLQDSDRHQGAIAAFEAMGTDSPPSSRH